MTTLRRLFWVAVLGGGGYAGWLFWQQRSSNDSGAAPEWPPLDPPVRQPTPDPPTAVRGPADDETAPRWVASDDGECPEGYPIKANDNSGIFHSPGGRFYDRTAPERCYARADDAEADGYRAAKT